MRALTRAADMVTCEQREVRMRERMRRNELGANPAMLFTTAAGILLVAAMVGTLAVMAPV